MADHTISITNSLNCFGPAPSTYWGSYSPYAMTWGTSLWGEGTQDLIVAIEKLLSNSITPSDDYFLHPDKLISNSIVHTSETTNEGLQSGNGYSYVFVGPTTEAEDRNLSTYTEGSAASTSYTAGASTSTTWSEA